MDKSIHQSRTIAIVAAIALSSACGSAVAGFSIYGTGVEVDGSLAVPGQPDSNYELIEAPAGVNTSSPLVATSILPVYVPGSPAAQWIGPFADLQGNSAPVGQYKYRQTFDLTNYAVGTFAIVGRFASDNSASILLNGVDTGVTTGSTQFTDYTDFEIESGYVEGLNTIDFVVTNAAGSGLNPTGLIVELVGSGTESCGGVTNLVVNCSFEHSLANGEDPLPGVVDPNTGLPRDAFGPPVSADSLYVLNNGSTAVEDWLAVSATPGATTDWVHSANYAASDGERSMDLNGTPGPGGVAQFLNVTPGARYRLEFDLAGNPRGLEDPDGAGPLVPPTSFEVTMEVDADGATQEFSFTVDGQTPADPGWERQSWELNTFDSELLLQLLSTTDPLYPGELIDFGPIVDNVSLVQIGVAGDYNLDGRVDAADYSVWRDNLGIVGLTPFSGADGNGDGQITDADYDIWRDNYGAAFGTALKGGGEAVPEPASIASAMLTIACLGGYRARRR